MKVMEALYIKFSVLKKFIFKIVSKAPYTYLHTRRASACLFIITRTITIFMSRISIDLISPPRRLGVWQFPINCTIFITLQ